MATHYIPSSRLADVQTSLAVGNHTAETINSILESFSGEYQPFSLQPQMGWIEKCFGKYEVTEIMTCLRELAAGGPAEASMWAQSLLGELAQVSPTALLATMEMLKRARRLSLMGCLRMEYVLAHEFASGSAPDFYEGVNAKLIAKHNKPQWSPPTIDKVSRNTIDKLFAPANEEALRKQMAFYSTADYTEMRKEYVLPTPAEIRPLTVEQVGAKYNWKMGIKLLAKQYAKASD